MRFSTFDVIMIVVGDWRAKTEPKSRSEWGMLLISQQKHGGQSPVAREDGGVQAL